ncbi:pre-toxin TG domain-containing protein [Metasolibacillus sp. FSL K6-0083]|uniref:pre-toxin TG domain-containing protein n=1 Tax=Metasolibacillus sp. FSL K6-0083 TaxID=2921416 RepID=UPI00315A0889
MGKFWKSIGKAIASIPVVGNAIKSAKKTAQKVKTEVKKVAEKVEAKLTELKESVEELLEELEESVEEALGKVTTYARKLQNNLDELALVQWVKNDAKSFVLATYKKTKKWVKGGWREGLSIGVDFIPVVGNLKAGIEAVIGIDPITGRKLSTAERAIAGAAIIGGPLVKGGKHVGKGAMKIIPNSNKLVDSLSKPLAKLKEGGQKVAEKAAAKATELKAQANAMIAQAKQGMRESMDNVGRALRGNEPQLAMAGANGAKVGTVKGSDSIVRMSKGESVGSGGTSKGTDKVNRQKQVEVAKDFAREQLDEHVKFLKNGGIKKPIDENGFGGGKYKPDVISAAVDITRVDGKKTKITFGYNGAREGQFNPSVMELHPDLSRIAQGTRKKAKNDPKNPYKDDESFEIWHVENCAEIQAVNQLLWSGSKIDDILISTINGNGKYKAPCKNCQETFLDFINDFRE